MQSNLTPLFYYITDHNVLVHNVTECSSQLEGNQAKKVIAYRGNCRRYSSLFCHLVVQMVGVVLVVSVRYGDGRF